MKLELPKALQDYTAKEQEEIMPPILELMRIGGIQITINAKAEKLS